MQFIRAFHSRAVIAAIVLLAALGTAGAQCVGDCDGDGVVSINELIRGVNINLGNQDLSACSAMDGNGDGTVAINELIQAVNNNLDGCPAECVGDGDCDDGNACTDDSCEEGSCVNEEVVCQDDGNECTAETCDPETGCGSDNVADGTSCDGGVGSCQDGVCIPAGEIEYEQDFESLDAMSDSALSDDGWVVYGNVFDGETGAYRYGYGANPAPNGGAAFSAIDSGQGGTEQGDQQLSIYSDYDNGDHANGDLIEANVYRERTITADDVGNILVFSFDAKRGNINDPGDPLCPCTSTAAAFIKTLNPAAGFATTNLVEQDTTAIPETWDRYSLMLEIDAGLENQVLQVGFTNTATLYQPSGVFYDNVGVSSLPTLP
jgi:hypothetical protein